MVETEPLWQELVCSSCRIVVQLPAGEKWAGFCPDCEPCLSCDWHD